MKRGTRTFRRVGNPTTCRSTSRRRMWSRFAPGIEQSGQVSATSTGSVLMMVRVPASAASVIVRPSSAVWQIVSATRLLVGCTVGSWFGQMEASQLSSCTGQGLCMLCHPASPSRLSYALPTAKSRITEKAVGYRTINGPASLIRPNGSSAGPTLCIIDCESGHRDRYRRPRIVDTENDSSSRDNNPGFHSGEYQMTIMKLASVVPVHKSDLNAVDVFQCCTNGDGKIWPTRVTAHQEPKLG